MKFPRLIALAATLAASAQALALGSSAQVSVIDRDSGSVLPTYYYRGEYWIAGRPGARYAVEIRNRAAGRLLAVTSVDGINVLTGATAGFEQPGYVFDPGETYQITGWRKSNSQVAAFTFTAAPNSYAERTGRPANVGVIGVALFRERAPERVIPPRIAQSAPPEAAASDANQAREAERSAPSAGALAAESGAKLGTGHGEREYSYVESTEFRRESPQPHEVIRIRYDSLENLVAMGVIRRPHPRPQIPDAFPGSWQYVPDPPG